MFFFNLLFLNFSSFFFLPFIIPSFHSFFPLTLIRPVLNTLRQLDGESLRREARPHYHQRCGRLVHRFLSSSSFVFLSNEMRPSGILYEVNMALFPVQNMSSI